MTQKDRFGIPGFHARKSGGFVYESSDDPTKDKAFQGGSETKKTGTNEVTMSPNGPTNFHLGKNVAGFSDSIGGCKLKFPDAASRGYAYKKDDVRDIELKGAFYFDLGSNGFSISACTGHHTGSKCCQGHAYMMTVQPSQNPYDCAFRKEMWHVSYHPSPGGSFKLPGLTSDKVFVGLGFCRYNVPGKDDQVAVEAWICTDPVGHPEKWTMIKKEIDKPGHGWGDDGDVCGGDKDQVITWSGPKNRFKTNATSGKVKAKFLSLIEIDPSIDGAGGSGGGGGGGTGGGGEPPPPPTTGTISRDWIIRYNLVAFPPDACGTGSAVPGLAKFYDVTDNGSSSNLHRDRYRCCMVANGSASKFIGKTAKRVVVNLSKTGSPPAGAITVVLRKGSDDTVAVTFTYTGGPSLDATALTTTKTPYTFENLTSTYVWSNGDRICVEYSSNTTDTANDVNVFRDTTNPYDGTSSCAVKFDTFSTGSPPPDGYSAADTSRDYAWEIWEGDQSTGS